MVVNAYLKQVLCIKIWCAFWYQTTRDVCTLLFNMVVIVYLIWFMKLNQNTLFVVMLPVT